jgi:hypothetical protein
LCGLFRDSEVEYLELSLTVAGTAASGELIPVSTRIPVGGAVRGRSLELAGMRDTGNGGPIERIEGLAVSVDQFGRLEGSFAYSRVFDGVTSTAKVDLVQVVKVP